MTNDREGAFTIEVQLYVRYGALLAMDPGQKMGGSMVIKAKGPVEPVTCCSMPSASMSR